MWQAEAAWAVEQWRAIFDPAQQKLLQPTTINNSRSYVLASDAARAAFEEVAQLVIQRVRELLAKRRLPHHIGSPEACASLLVDPLSKKALDSISKLGTKAKQRGFDAFDNMIGGPLAKDRQKIENRAATLRSAIAAEVTIRLEEINAELSKEQMAVAAATTKNKPETWLQSASRRIGVIRNLWWPIGVLFTIALWAWSGFPLPF